MAGGNNNHEDAKPAGAFDDDVPMSEILASIRKSITEDNPPEPARSGLSRLTGKSPAPAKPDDDVLELTVEVDEDGAALPDRTMAGLQIGAGAIADELMALEAADPDSDIEALIASAEADLAEAEGQDSPVGHNGQNSDAPLTPVEAFVADLVREWLDKNMPDIIERIIREKQG